MTSPCFFFPLREHGLIKPADCLVNQILLFGAQLFSLHFSEMYVSKSQRHVFLVQVNVAKVSPRCV